MKLPIPPFTLIGATTRAGLLTSPLRDRFGMSFRFDFYSLEELVVILKRSAWILGIHLDDPGAAEIARRSRGTPRIANRLLRRIRDYAQVKGTGVINHDAAVAALDLLDVDHQGFDWMDRMILLTVIENFKGAPWASITSRRSSVKSGQRLRTSTNPICSKKGFSSEPPGAGAPRRA